MMTAFAFVGQYAVAGICRAAKATQIGLGG